MTARCDVCGHFTKEEDLVLEEESHLDIHGDLHQTWTAVCARHWPHNEREQMTTDDKPQKKAASTFTSLSVKRTTAIEVRKEAEARGMLVGEFADRLVQYGLANLVSVNDTPMFD